VQVDATVKFVGLRVEAHEVSSSRGGVRFPGADLPRWCAEEGTSINIKDKEPTR
jgi:hypothetical protein